MASSSLTKLVFFACWFLLFAFSANLVAGQSDQVHLNIYYDSLFSGCQDFIVNNLIVIFGTDLYTITNVTLVPFGNDLLSDNQTVTCQRGVNECVLNKYAACIIKTFPDPALHYSFIRCIENDIANWSSSCFNDPADQKAVIDCYNSDISTKLILGYANQTLSLNPKLDFIPWITVNGVPLYTQNIGDLVTQVCTAYQGKAPLPTPCSVGDFSDKKPWSKL